MNLISTGQLRNSGIFFDGSIDILKTDSRKSPFVLNHNDREEVRPPGPNL